MLQLYDQFETEFKTNGEMLNGAYDAEIIHYLNSEYTLKFIIKQADEKAHLIKNDAIILADNQPFRILTPKISGDSIEVYAVHVFYDLKDYQVEAVNVDAVSGQTVMNAIFNNANTNFTWMSDITKLSTMNEEKKNIIEMLNIAIERFEGELVRNKFDVRLNNKAGTDTEVLIYPEKNISTSIKEVDTTDVCTRVIVEYGDYEDKKQVIVTSPNIDLYSHPKTKRYQNVTDDIQTEAEAIDWGLAKFSGINRIDVPKVSIEIDVLLDDSLKTLNIGDTVICKIPNLNLDERIQIIGYAYDPLLERKTKIYAGYKAKGLGGSIIGGAVEAIRPEIADVDKDLQAKIDAANAAIDKEYNDRVQAVKDAIAKAEADAQAVKEALSIELGQAMTDWDTAFEENKAQVDASIGNVSGILGDYIASNDEVVAGINTDLGALFDGVDANAGSIVEVSNELGTLSTKVGTVEVTANSASGTASEAKQTADSLKTTVGSWNVETDGTLSSAVSTVEQTASGLTSTVSSHTTSISGLETITKTHTSQISQTSDKISLIVSDGSTASAVQLTPNAMKFISEEINLFGNVIFNSLVDESTTEILGDKIKTGTIKTSTLLVDKEILVDGTVKAQHFVGGTAELAEITTILFKSEVLQTAWASIGQAVVGQLTADDALLNSLTAKQAFITSVQAIDFQAERVVGGYLRSTNGSYEQNLNSGETLYKTGADVSRIKMGDFYDVRGLYMQAGVSNAGTELMLSKTGMAYFNADHISLGRSSQNAGFKFITNSYTGTTNPAANRIIPWTAGTGSFGQGSYPCYEVRVYNITDLYSVNRVSTTLSMHEAFQELNALEVVDSTQVNSYITPDQTTQKFNLEDDQPKKVRIGIDFTNLRRSRSVDSTLLFNEQNEMTLNTEIAILWKAVQELSAQINELKGA